MSILGWLIIGGLAGWVASMIMKTNESMGIILNIVVGVTGALIGGFIFSLLGFSGNGLVYSFVIALVGAIILIAIVKAIRK